MCNIEENLPDLQILSLLQSVDSRQHKESAHSINRLFVIRCPLAKTQYDLGTILFRDPFSKFRCHLMREGINKSIQQQFLTKRSLTEESLNCLFPKLLLERLSKMQWTCSELNTL